MPPDFTPAEGVNIMDSTRRLPFLGRLLIGLPFAIGGLSKLAAYGPTTAMIAEIGLPVPPLAFAIAVAIELGGGLLLIAGYKTMIEERDISVAMRDGTRLAVDVYRPDKPGKYPVLYAAACITRTFKAPTSRTYCRRNRLTRRSGSVP
jgi:hypothetical protein